MAKLLVMTNPFEKIDDEVNFLKDFDLDGIEISLEYPEWYLKSECLKFKELFLIGHTRCDLEFASENLEKRNNSIKEFKKNLDFLKKLNLEYVNIHPHYNKNISKELSQQYNISALKEIVNYAEKLNIKIMIENQFPFESYFEMKKVFDKFDNIYLLFDIAHAYYMNNEKDKEVKKFIQLFSNRIKHVHLSDNDGYDDDHYFIGHGSIDFEKYFDLMNKYLTKDITYSLEPFVIDLGNQEWRVATKQERRFLLKESIEKIKKLI